MIAAAGRILVTGATGFLGQHVVAALLQHGYSNIRIVTTGVVPKSLSGCPIEVISGSLTHPEVIRRAVDGVQVILHLAGRVSRQQSDAHTMHDLHVTATRQLCEMAKQAGVGRMVLASTSGTIAVSDRAELVPDETASPPLHIISRWPYYASKYYQEQAALFVCDNGGPHLVILNPSLLLGPGDDRLSSTADVLKFLRRQWPGAPTGGINFVDVRDVAAAFVAAITRGENRHRYLLGSVNWRFSEFLGRLERMTKVAAPKLQLPKELVRLSATWLDQIYSKFDALPPIDCASVEMSTYYWYLNDNKARSELGFTTRDPSDTLLDTVAYLKAHHTI